MLWRTHSEAFNHGKVKGGQVQAPDALAQPRPARRRLPVPAAGQLRFGRGGRSSLRLAAVFTLGFRVLTSSRRLRKLTVLMSLWALLFAQTALAGYACPGAAKAAEVARMAAHVAAEASPCSEMMSMAGTMDEGNEPLCHAHCQSSQGASDPGSSAHAPDPGQAAAVLTVRLAPTSARPSGPQLPLLRVAASPPLAITHCCFRI